MSEEQPATWYLLAARDFERRVGATREITSWAESRWERLRLAGLRPDEAVDALLSEIDARPTRPADAAEDDASRR